MPGFAAMFSLHQALQLVLALLVLQGTSALYFEDGFDHHYTYSSESDILGLHNITTIIKFRIRNANLTTSDGSLCLLMVDSFVQHSEKGYVADNPLRWKLDHKFYFTVGIDGLVTLVHFHPEEKDEVLTLKKVLASTLSTNVQIESGEAVTSTEEDHAGILEQQYTAEMLMDGRRITRSHKSSKEVHRAHDKTVHLDGQGTPVHIYSADNITLRSAPKKATSFQMEGVADIPEEQSGEFPQIASVSRSKVKLTAKSKHFDPPADHNLGHLMQETLLIREKPKPKVPMSTVETEIREYLACIHAIPNKYDRNRTECVNQLRALVKSLERDDFIKLGETALTQSCEQDDYLCVDERNLFLDIISHEGSADAQLMMLNLVMKHPNASEEDIRRCLFHCIAIKSPVVELVEHVESLCFADDAVDGETPALSKNRKRACLSLGAMAKSLHANNVTVSDRIVERLENWLQHHNQTKSAEIVKPRRRRSIIQHDSRARKHVETKMVLLQSLGNAGKNRSIQHLKSYMAPNVGVTAWRRAAIHGLRHFACDESAHGLVMSAAHDENEVVRKTALSVLEKHPKRDKFSVEHENIVLSKNYTYPVVARVRRSLMQALVEGIRVHLQSPGIEWDKVIGNHAIGASFGLHIRNILDLKLGLLDGHFSIDVYDGAFAEAHVGVVNFQVDILKAYICFNGHIKYDLNVLKDFGINSLSDIVHIYDKIVAKIIDPIVDAVKKFKEIITFFKNRTLTDIINTLVNTVKNLPHILGDVAIRLEEFVQEIYSIAGNTIMEEIKVIVQHIRNFVDGVKSDVLKFYNDIVDAVTMALPYIGKKIVEAFNLIVQGVKALFSNPMQGITAMGRAITDMKMAVTMFMDTKTNIENACKFITGRVADWINTAKQIPQILKRLGEAFKKITASIRNRRDLVEDMTSVYSDGIEQAKDSLHRLEDDLKAKWNKVLEPLQPLLNITKPFVDEYKAVMDVVKGLKWGYRKVKETIETTKKLVQKVFGPKFHKAFPTERRPKRGNCKEGVWPSTGEDQYKTTGVDLTLGEGQTVRNPVNGIVEIKGNNKVVIKPIDAEFSSFEIVIENIATRPEISSGKNYPAGEKIGRATKSPKCQPNFIHVSVRQASEKELPDDEYKYTDPGPFLDRLVPIPKWIQECNDHEFRYIGQTFESGESTEDEEPEEKSEKIERDDDASNFNDGEENEPYRPDDPSLYDPKPFGDSLKDSLKEEAKKFAEFFKTALFGGDGPKVPNILSIVNVSGKKITWVLDHLKNKTITSELNGVIDGLCSKMTALPKGNPLTFAVPYVKNILKMNGMSSKIGDMSKMSDKLMKMAENACPLFRGAIAVGFGHICSVQEDCLGISCSVPLPKGAKTEHVQIGVSVKPSDGKVEVTVNGKRVQDIIADGADAEFDLKVSFFGMKLQMAANLEFKNGVLSLSAEAKLCVKIFSTCLPPVELFHDIKFKALAPRHRRGIGKAAICAGLSALSVPNFIGHLGNYQLLNKKITGVLEQVRSTVVEELLNDAVDKIGEVTKEFTDKVDFCLSANIPVPPFDIEFFDLKYRFFAGPVPLSLGFGAGGSVGLGVKVGLCVLSMTTQLTLTPWVGGKVWGSFAVDIGFAEGGIKLIGYLMETQFPILTELVFSKYPIDTGAKMDLVLKPLRLKLKAYAKLNLLFKKVTVFDANIWEYSVPTITKNIFYKKKRDDDKSPPDILPDTINARKKREGTRGCIVRQVSGRPYYSPAFTLEMHAQDEVSEVKLFYAIGTHRGGTNVVDWTEMGGASLLAPSQLPGGVPLYWTVKARNSQGLEAIQQCSLKTYDSTLPDGRVEHSYKFSSHPSKLQASVVVFEDSPLVETHYKAVGFSPGQFGSQFVDWATLSLDHSVAREGVSGYLRHFTVAREGKLVAWILQTQQVRTAEMCAQKCIEYGQNCVSFDYEYHSETCDFHDVVQGANAYLRISGTYSNYERLGSGYHTPIEYNNLPLNHGATYFVNARVTNVLGYNAFLIGEGTLVDFTPPEPGLIQNAAQDVLKADKCNAAVTQKCIDVTWKDNHRLIIDGAGSGTVFNGHEPVFDQLYTLTNHYVTANWKGFHDDESGIWGYTWSVGTKICGSDIIQFEDPYAHLTDKKFWTDSAFHKGIHLDDGAYYVSVQALNGAELGGSLVTTVCHSTPFIVDTTPPVFNKVTDIIYDEDFDLIAIYYNAFDSLSKIAKAEFGLGRTKYDVQLKPYSLHASMDRDDPFVAVEDLGLKEGIPAWLRIRVTNNVDLFTAGHGDEPILIDKSPPIPGHVLDGDRLRQDRTYQSEDTRICAQWVDFYDPESGLDRFMWGVGTAPKLDDVIKFHNLTHYDKSSCAAAALQHNHTYYSTVFAFNNALNSKSTNSSSDGVLVDTTPPIPGTVLDGQTGKDELQYTSETVSKHANWRGYHDPESGIAAYKVDVFINNEHKKTFDVSTATEFEDHTISMEHLDKVYFNVHGINGAELEAAAHSDGFLVDHTPPIMTAISDNNHGSAYQSDNSNMHLSWNFYDGESNIKEYRTVIYVTKFGVKQQFWPEQALLKYNLTKPLTPSHGKMSMVLSNLTMEDGALYTLHVTALNGALLATSHETTGVTVDTTPPSAPQVRLGLPKEEEELDDEGRALHNDQHAIRLSWTGRDPESGIQNYKIAIGTNNTPECVSPWTDYGQDTTAYIQHINFQTFTESGKTYVVSIKAINGAGLESEIGQSLQIYVQKANIPGVVFDGRDLFVDAMYTIDRTSIAASFYGFESESCNIIGYEWAIGTAEYGTDVLSYTDYGVVMLNDTHGQAQIHQELYEDTTYYITIRAVTGCYDEYIMATSDGITLDMTPPEVIYSVDSSNDSNTVIIHDVLFQDAIDTIALTSNVTDTHSIDSVTWALGSLPLLDDRHPFTDDLEALTSVIVQQPGQVTFLTTDTKDKAGNRNITSSLAIMSDITAPEIKDLSCTQYLSYRKSILNCEWDTLVEYESLIHELKVKLTTNDGTVLLHDSVLPKGIRTFTKDLYHELSSTSNMSTIYATFDISNVVGKRKTYGREIIVDSSKPEFDELFVVTSTTLSPAETHQKCQLPTAYAELRLKGIKDTESEIDTGRFKVSLGLKPYGTEILNYVDSEQRQDGTFFIDGFSLNVGTVFYATIRIYNKAGLYADVTSDSVVVSQSPYLKVIDGDGEGDIDYQSLPNLVQGRWEYSDVCPIAEAHWSVRDLTGAVLFDFQTIPSAGKKFYNDEVALENGKKYIVTVKTVDALGRTKIGHSDGITVRIQPPFPGHVRDGKTEDINYQYSNTELSANWDNFGDDSKDPTQSIHHYEVAIGNDRRYEKTRSNVHYFVNVGLNTSYTFNHLNLTQKLVRYYITVRSYSLAGGYAEGYSNGIRVGYNDEIIPGTISVNEYQSEIHFMAFSWTGFQSDINILLFKVGISSHENMLSNDTLKCSFFEENTTIYDVSNLKSVGLNEYTNVKNISLQHGQSYYVTVIAMDEAGMCTAVTSSPVVVDTTPPETGELYINDVKSDVISFATSDTNMHISWNNVKDPESGITESKVSLLECNSCHPTLDSQNCVTIAENVVHNDVKTAFYDIELYPTKSYVVKLLFKNGARLTSLISSATVLIDSTPPLPGEVKITRDWKTVSNYQHSTSEIHGLIAFAGSHEDYLCRNQIQLFPSNEFKWNILSSKFSSDFQIDNSSGAYLGIGYSSDLSSITKSGIISNSQSLKRGNYSFVIRTAFGQNIITTAAFLTDEDVIPFSIPDKPDDTEFDFDKFENVSGLVSTSDNETDTINSTISPTTERQPGEFVPNNDTGKKETILNSEQYGFGVHFLGYKIGNNKGWWHVFWARNKISNFERWFRTPFDPTTSDHEYKILVKQKGLSLDIDVDLVLFVDHEEIVSISGFKYDSDMRLSYLTWNEDDYEPPIENVFHPFYSEAIVKRIDIPDTTDKPCLRGRGFYDGESGIKEIYIGVSDNKNEMGNVVPLHHYQSFCFPCIKPCAEICKAPCNDTRLTEGFTLIPIQINSLDLQITDTNDTCLNASVGTKCNSTTYYLNARLINFAGKETNVYSNGIQLDVTPPVFEYVNCVDPEYNEDAPTSHIGSNSTIGAYWYCLEDFSQVETYTVTIISGTGKQVLNQTSVGQKTKVKFNIGEGMFEDGHDYEVKVTAVNTAGLNTTSSCSVHVSLYPPDVSSASAEPLYTEPVASVTVDETYWTSSQSAVGLTWNGGTNDTEFYEWQIGTADDEADIFPAAKVGQNATGSTAIVEGKLELDKTKSNTTMGDFRDRTNMTAEELVDFQSASERKKAFFYMEPGRCMHQSLYAVGYSHLRSKIQGRTVCVRRPGDVNVDASEGKTAVISRGKLTLKWEKKKASLSDVVFEAKLTSGGISVGTLNTTDKTMDYGSAATIDYKPFISDPSVTGSQVTRMLRNRIERFCGVSFYISPTPTVTFEEIAVNVTVPSGCDKDPDFQPALIYWDVAKQLWTHADEGCYDYPTAVMDLDKNIYMAKICSNSSHSRGKRSTPVVTMNGPRAYEIVHINRTFPNTPPTIVSDSLTTKEDSIDELIVETYDPENDTLIFEILEQPENAICTIGSNSGRLNCTLEDDFYGENYISVRVTETGLPATEQGLTVSKKLVLNIQAMPDKTDRFFLDTSGSVHENIRPFLHHVITVEANTTDSLDAGTVILADMDGGEIFTTITNFTSLGSSVFTMVNVPLQQGNHTAKFNRYRSLQAYNLSFEFSPDINGNMTWNFIAKTADGKYTPSVTVDLFVLKNPCVFGTCTHPAHGASACASTDRAASFDGYVCLCTPGYQGTWCEVEINECDSDPCSSMYDCEDLVNGFECNLNVLKLMAILFSCTLVIIGVGFGVFKLRQYHAFQKLRQSQISLTNDKHPYGIDADSRPVTPFLPDRPDTASKVHPVFSLQKNFGNEVDISALSSFTTNVGSKLPPHHNSFKPKTKVNQPKPEKTKVHYDNGGYELDEAGSDVVNVAAFSGICREPRCPSAASQRTVSTLEGDHVMLKDRLGGMTDIDV